MPTTHERRSSALAPVLSTDAKHIEGRAAVFYNAADPGTEYIYRMMNPQNPKGEPIEVRERIFPGAFTRALAEDEVVCYYNHEHNIGRRVAGDPSNTMELSVDARGLNYRTLLPDHMYGQMVREAIQRKDVRGSSFQFAPRPGGVTWRQEGKSLVRELRDLFLYDASPVDRPAYTSTTADLRSECRAEERDAIVPLLSTPDSPLPTPDQRQWDADRATALRLRLKLGESE